MAARWIAVIAMGWALATVLVAATGELWRNLSGAVDPRGVSTSIFYLMAAACAGVTQWQAKEHVATPWLPRADRRTGAAFAAGAAGTAFFYAGAVHKIWRGDATGATAAALFSGVVLAPLIEEWLFRGQLWRFAGGDAADTKTRAGALVATSIAYAVWHEPFPGEGNLIIHGLFGLLLGAVRWTSGGLWPVIVLHAAGAVAAVLATGGG